MRLISDSQRGRRIGALWIVILCELVGGVAGWASYSAPASSASARSTGPAAAGTIESTQDSQDPSAPVAGVATQALPTSGATTTGPQGPVRVTPGAGGVTVTWNPVKTRSPLQYYTVVATEASSGYSGTLVTCASCTSATFRGLRNGGRYTFLVTPTTSSGAGQGLQSPAAVPNSDLCAGTAACVAVDGGVQTGTSDLAAQGFLHGIDQQTNASRVSALKPQFWRHSGWAKTQGYIGPTGAATTQILSDYWAQNLYDKNRGGVVPPWENWDNYRSFVTKVVTGAEQQGWAPAYWEVFNEPDAGYPYPPGTDVSIQDTLDVYLNGYEAIKAADPNARVVGPSLTGFTIDPVKGHPEILDITTFLNFANAHSLKFDAITWHETGAQHLQPFDRLPEAAQNHIDRLRGELFRWPNIGKPKLFVNEYGAGPALDVPGWRVGYLASLEAADVDSGNTTCWPLTGNVGTCYAGTLGGLLDTDKSTPRAAYWVHLAYADMHGTRVSTSDSVQSLSAFAVGGSNGPWQILLGRHQSCTSPVNPMCPEPASAVPAPIPVTVAMRVGGPDRSITVVVQRIPDEAGDVPDAPPSSTQQFAVKGGVVHFSVPSFADGDAYSIHVG